MSCIPDYPKFAPLSLEMAREMSPHLVKTPDGISEYSFAGLYLFRNKYQYKVSKKHHFIIISGEQNGKTFFITPCCTTDSETIHELFGTHDVWKLISLGFIKENKEFLDTSGYTLLEDRDNFDYVYLRSDLASLSGKKFHKKKNHVNAFELAYPDFSVKHLDSSTRKDARIVLELWKESQQNPEKTDYAAACEALDLLEFFDMSGLVLYVSGTPVAWTLAEFVASGSMSAVHFEKARIDFRGAFQYINYAYAQSLPESVEFINREQDLGDEGMRQAKMTYRPVDFVKKYRVEK